jgi:hypothetical protein
MICGAQHICTIVFKLLSLETFWSSKEFDAYIFLCYYHEPKHELYLKDAGPKVVVQNSTYTFVKYQNICYKCAVCYGNSCVHECRNMDLLNYLLLFLTSQSITSLCLLTQWYHFIQMILSSLNYMQEGYVPDLSGS